MHVVKNVTNQSLEVKKLVYLYLLHYADKYVIFVFPMKMIVRIVLLENVMCFQEAE